MPLDGVDMFLITRLEGTVELAELLSLVPGAPEDVMRRAHRLATLGVIETVGPEPLEWLALAPIPAPPARDDGDDDIMTLRPPKMATVDYEVMTTRPPSVSLDDMMTLRPPPPRSETQLRAAIPEVSVKRALEQVRANPVRIPEHSMSRELRIEDDNPTRARRLLKR